MGFTYLPKDGEAVWSNLPQDVDILVTLCPSFGIMDQSVHSKLNTGCKGLLQAVVKMRPKLHIFGHIHEGHGHIV
jgi:Icc-related predicted phosphoesterase